MYEGAVVAAVGEEDSEEDVVINAVRHSRSSETSSASDTVCCFFVFFSFVSDINGTVAGQLHARCIVPFGVVWPVTVPEVLAVVVVVLVEEEEELTGPNRVRAPCSRSKEVISGDVTMCKGAFNAAFSTFGFAPAWSKAVARGMLSLRTAV